MEKTEPVKMLAIRATYSGPNDSIGKLKLKHGSRYDIAIYRNKETKMPSVYVFSASKYGCLDYEEMELFASDWGRGAVEVYNQL